MDLDARGGHAGGGGNGVAVRLAGVGVKQEDARRVGQCACGRLDAALDIRPGAVRERVQDDLAEWQGGGPRGEGLGGGFLAGGRRHAGGGVASENDRTEAFARDANRGSGQCHRQQSGREAGQGGAGGRTVATPAGREHGMQDKCAERQQADEHPRAGQTHEVHKCDYRRDSLRMTR